MDSKMPGNPIFGQTVADNSKEGGLAARPTYDIMEQERDSGYVLTFSAVTDPLHAVVSAVRLHESAARQFLTEIGNRASLYDARRLLIELHIAEPFLNTNGYHLVVLMAELFAHGTAVALVDEIRANREHLAWGIKHAATGDTTVTVCPSYLEAIKLLRGLALRSEIT